MPAASSAHLPRRIVVKLGTGVLTTGIGQLNTERIAALAAGISGLRASGVEVVVVSSGAVGLGMGRLGLKKKPSAIARKQACAAIGQSLLMQTWQRAFDPHGATVAQVLLTHEDLRSRARHLGVKACLQELLDYGVVPVINENDTVSAAEIKFGDNDTLSALVAGLVDAQHLVILSTAPGLIDMKGTGKILPVVEKITPEIEAMAGGTTDVTATGGMISKISAAKVALRAGCAVSIASGAEPDILARLFRGDNPGTTFIPAGVPLESRKRWIAHYQRPTGEILVNANAVPALRDQGRSLLAIGVTGSRGRFAPGDIVNILGPDDTVLARGETAFGDADIARIAGLPSEKLKPLFPGRKHLEVIHRDDLVVL
ncbi:MAG: glutamate 5-kinase [Opitutaceae bacterium]|jgi:glutamate 5-kinase|nr:glutamate 5-kinase [Opitutaceae bacterium]